MITVFKFFKFKDIIKNIFNLKLNVFELRDYYKILTKLHWQIEQYVFSYDKEYNDGLNHIKNSI